MKGYTFLEITEKMPGSKCIALCKICGSKRMYRTSRVTSSEQLSCGCISKYKPKKEFTGKTINNILILGYVCHSMWRCLYSCGHTNDVKTSSFLNSKTGRCNMCSKKIPTTLSHGHSLRSKRSGEYQSWGNMKRRCYDPNNNRSQYYLEKGITVCDEWLNSFPNFLRDMGPKPHKSYSLERKDLTKRYDKENCKWADDITQANNKTNNIHIEHEGITYSLKRWCVILDMNYKHCWYLLKRKGIDISSILGKGYNLVVKNESNT